MMSRIKQKLFDFLEENITDQELEQHGPLIDTFRQYSPFLKFKVNGKFDVELEDLQEFSEHEMYKEFSNMTLD